MTTVAEITARDWSPKLGKYGEVVTNMDDISQCLRIVFSTPIGSVPLRRDFGSRWQRSIDKPYAVAQANIPLDILESARWEPRATIVAVRVSPSESNIAGMRVEVDWRQSGENTTQIQTLVLTDEQCGITSDANRIITGAMAEAALDADVHISNYSEEFLTALND